MEADLLFETKAMKQTINQSRQPASKSFLSNLQIDDCNLLGVDNLLQVNEVFEDYKVDQGLHESQYSVSQHFADTDETLALEICNRLDVTFKDINLQTDEEKLHRLVRDQLTTKEDKKLLANFNNIDDVVTGNQRILQAQVRRKMQN